MQGRQRLGPIGEKMTDLNQPARIIATRTLQLSEEKGVSESVPVVVEIYEPQSGEAEYEYFCWYKICGLGDERLKRCVGVDAVQALLVALVRIGSDLYSRDETKAGRLTWNQDENLGIPVPFRDALPDGTTSAREYFF